MLAPAGASNENIRRVNTAIVRALQLPDVKARLENNGYEIVGSTPEAFSKWIAEAKEKFERVLREQKITTE